jgi:hypothetical protein
MDNQTVLISDLQFVMSGECKTFAFNLNDGTPVFYGDTVQFFNAGDVFPTSGLLQNVNGPVLICFRTVLNKWRCVDIKGA